MDEACRKIQQSPEKEGQDKMMKRGHICIGSENAMTGGKQTKGRSAERHKNITNKECTHRKREWQETKTRGKNTQKNREDARTKGSIISRRKTARRRKRKKRRGAE